MAWYTPPCFLMSEVALMVCGAAIGGAPPPGAARVTRAYEALGQLGQDVPASG